MIHISQMAGSFITQPAVEVTGPTVTPNSPFPP